MSKESISERLERIIGVYTDGKQVEPDADLMAKPVSLPPYDMAALFLDIEKEFGVDLNKLVPGLEIYSPNLIAEKIAELCVRKDKEPCYT